MARRTRLTDEKVAALPTKSSRYTFADPELPAHYVRIYPTGKKSFVVVQNNVWTTIGDARVWTIEKAREKARIILRGEAVPESVEAVIKLYAEKHVSKLRSAREPRRYLEMIEYEFRGREFSTIKRNELARLADKTAEKHGRRAAEYLLITFSAMAHWYMRRNEDYRSPMAPGMAREFHGQARSRILSDDELRAVWKESERRGDRFGAVVRLALLTGQRREKIVSMRWSDVEGSTWKIRTEEGEKGNAGELVLPQVALAIINEQARVDGNLYVFAARAGSHLNGFSVYKAELDTASGVTAWRLHDLRRTARSLMSRAGIAPHVAERVLGHVQPGVLGVYDRHSYLEEKEHALAALARMIESIVTPPAGSNVARLRKVG